MRRDRTLVALAGLPTDPPPTEETVVEEVALRYADRFEPADRAYALAAETPRA